MKLNVIWNTQISRSSETLPATTADGVIWCSRHQYVKFMRAAYWMRTFREMRVGQGGGARYQHVLNCTFSEHGCQCGGICTIRWINTVNPLKPSGHYMYHQVVTICTTSLTFNDSTFCPYSVFICFVWISEQTAIISLYNINWLVFITETECVYCAVRTGYLNIVQVNNTV